MQFPYLPLFWDQKSLVLSFYQLLLLHQKIGKYKYYELLNLVFLFLSDLTMLIIASFRVPNIKFNVAKVLQSLIPIVDQLVSKYCLCIGM